MHRSWLLLAVVLLWPGAASASAGDDPVRFTFAVVGCNRVEYEDWKKDAAQRPNPNPSSANLNQLRQTFADLAALRPVPTHLFFTGDLVMNEADDTGATLKGQLDAWAQVYQRDPSGIARALTLVPMPGNHELLKFLEADSKANGARYGVEVPNRPTDRVWVDWLKANALDTVAGNGPTNRDPGNPDRLVNDQSKLTFSFDVDDVHFLVLNTDTANDQENTGWVAYHWTRRDIERAQANPKTRAIFVLGHKPLVMPIESSDDFGSVISPLNFWLQELFRSTPKFRAYICAHAHQWELQRLRGVWQLVAGNGGSTLAPDWKPPGGPYFGFTLVRLHASGRVGVVDHRRPVPATGYLGPTVPARPEPEVFLD